MLRFNVRSLPILLFSFIILFFSQLSLAELAPEFKLPEVTPAVANEADAAKISLKDFKGQVVYLDFWATWCPPCRKSFPWMNEMHERYQQQGLKIIAVSVDRKRELVQKFLEEMPAQFTVVQDSSGNLAKQYELRGMPTSFLIDRQGSIAATHFGFRSKDKEKLEAAIQQLLNQ